MTGRVTAVGLGPAGADLVTPAARRALGEAADPLTRTAAHPAVAELRDEGLILRSLDHHYESSSSLAATYAGIVDDVLGVAERDGRAVYAVPGNPVVAERTVALLRDRLGAGLTVVPGLSFADVAWARLGVDPSDGARVVDGHSFAVDAAGVSGPILVSQCDRVSVLSEVKLVLLDAVEPDTLVTVLQRLGSADESVREVPLVDLDRVITADPRTSVFVDTGERSVAAEMARFVDLMATLRGPGGCPWDAEQTHHSLAGYVLEEAHEVVEAVQALPPEAPAGDVDPAAYANLAEELGDLLCQIVFHTVLATEAGAFELTDVIDGIHTKLVRRHPHVFADVAVDDSDEVLRNWEQIKREERGSASVLTGVDDSLPVLLYTHKLLRKALSVGLDAEAETSLRNWAAQFRERFAAVEQRAEERGDDLTTLSPDAVVALWNEIGSPNGGDGHGVLR